MCTPEGSRCDALILGTLAASALCAIAGLVLADFLLFLSAAALCVAGALLVASYPSRG